jgi:hypothetical protein
MMHSLFSFDIWNELDAIPIYIAMVLGMYGCLELGRSWGRKQLARKQSVGKEWIGIVDGVCFGKFITPQDYRKL